MASFFDLFNSTFFIFLATLLLVTALLVVYFEGKMREQNHKISSMLSLVSSLAEEFNIINTIRGMSLAAFIRTFFST
jgi:type II secretory pathway component PulF